MNLLPNTRLLGGQRQDFDTLALFQILQDFVLFGKAILYAMKRIVAHAQFLLLFAFQDYLRLEFLK